MVFQNMDMGAPRGEMKDPVRREHKNATAPIFGKWSSDVAGDRAEPVEQFDRLRSAMDSDSLYSIVRSRPDRAGRVLEQAANTFLMEACLLAYVDCGARGLTDNSPVVCTDPKVAAATYQQRVHGLAGGGVGCIYMDWAKAQTIKGRHSAVGGDQQPAARHLGDGAQLALRQAVLYLPLLLLIFGEGNGAPTLQADRGSAPAEEATSAATAGAVSSRSIAGRTAMEWQTPHQP